MPRLSRAPTTPDMVPQETRMIRIPADQIEALYRRAEGDVDTLEDLVLWVVRAEMEAEAEAARAAALPYEDLRNEITRVEYDIHTRINLRSCPMCRRNGHWRRSNTDEQKQPWTDLNCPVCLQPAKRGILDPCFHSLCLKCRLRAPLPDATPTRAEAIILTLGRNPEYKRWAKKNPRC